MRDMRCFWSRGSADILAQPKYAGMKLNEKIRAKS